MAQQYPVCYVLQHKKFGTFVPHTGFASAMAHYMVEHYTKDENWGSRWYTTKMELVKMWPTHKKMLRWLTKEASSYFYVVGSDHTVIDAETLFP